MIESEYVFNVAGTNSNGELLCSTLRHRLFGTNEKKNHVNELNLLDDLKKKLKIYLQKLLCSQVLKLFLSTVMTPVKIAAAHKIVAKIFILPDCRQ